MRRRFGWTMVGISAALLLAFAGLGVPWPWRALVFFPAAAAATGFLQVRRETCLLRSAEGSCELDDGATQPASEDDARASRAVARTIRRDAVLIGLAIAGLAITTALV
jgi:hypothetical protein